MKGRIHSIESMGLVDGPGIRTVVFMQGCNLRCIYCHNPDTWNFSSGELVEADELIKKIKRFKPYFKNNGGVTFSGGEPLLQKEFLLEMLKKCKEENIHTCIDTAGYAEGDFSEILKYTDMVIFDIKHEDSLKFREIVKGDLEISKNFLKQVQKNNIPLWIRHVVVPEITDDEEHIKELGKYIKNLRNVEKIELLPFHQLGANKYQEMKIKYDLEGKEPMDKDEIIKLDNVLLKEIGG